MSNALALVTQDIFDTRVKFESVLSDKSLNFEREAGFAIQVLSANDYALGTAVKNRQSVIDAVTNIAAIGLSLNPAKKLAYLVPRNGKICLDISYMGLMDLAIATGSIKWAQAELVRENDLFVRGSFDKPPKHEFNPFANDRGAVIGVYVVVKTADGDFLTEVMGIGEVFDIRDRSEAWKAYVAKKTKSCPWSTDEGEMIKKTVIKRAYKYWPKTDRLEKAIEILNTENGEGINFNEQQRGADWIDVEPLIVEALQTKTDEQALAYWRSNNAKFSKQPSDYTKLKEAVARHREALKTTDEARTVEMPYTSNPISDDSTSGFVDAMDNTGYTPE
jgi:recombination protein RecT